MNNKLKIAIISTTVATVSLLSAGPAMAATYVDGQKVGFFDRVALMLGFKKNLTPEQKTQRIEEMKQRREAKLNTRLDGLVSAGKIIEAQKTELKAKLDAIQLAKLNSAEQTKDGRKQAAKQAHDELKAWAESNGINLSDILPNRPAGRKGAHTLPASQ